MKSSTLTQIEKNSDDDERERESESGFVYTQSYRMYYIKSVVIGHKNKV